jgi:hypothetical protein
MAWVKLERCVPSFHGRSSREIPLRSFLSEANPPCTPQYIQRSMPLSALKAVAKGQVGYPSDSVNGLLEF